MTDQASNQIVSTRSPKNGLWLLFWISVISLFLELVLIRWISTEVRIFAYLQSSVLVVCLMGLGMGCFASKRAINLQHVFVPLVLISGLFAVPVTYKVMSNISMVLSQFGNFNIWGGTLQSGASTWGDLIVLIAMLILTALMLFLVWIVFIPLGQMVARLINDQDNTVTAYSVNIFGSFVGIGLFTGASAIGLSPTAWFGLLSIAFVGLALRTDKHRVLNVILALSIPLLVWGGDRDGEGSVLWSPYQKLELGPQAYTDPQNGETYNQQVIYVNNVGYQAALDLRLEFTQKYPGLFDQNLAGLSQYDLPTLFKQNAENVLIVGAGSGNDVAGVLRGNAGHVTAVEIDPVIIELGKAIHPEAPYADPRVTVVNDDARSFMARTTETYDLIIFGLLDSHTAGPMTNARLDHYVYTTENFKRAKALLKPGGVVFLAFEARKPYLLGRMNNALSETFGYDPLKFRMPLSHYGFGGAMFVAGDQKVIDQALVENPRLSSYVQDLQSQLPIDMLDGVEVISDDWPYLYLEERTIPVLYGVLGVILLVIYLLSGRLVGLEPPLKGWRKGEWHFFFMGAAFMLLEVHMIAKASVALGSVWTVNAVIIGGIMGMILIANLVKAKVRNLPMRLIYGLLIASCAVLYFVDLSAVSSMPYAQKAVIIAGIATLPMLFSGIVFINSFDAAADKGRALGANLFGALVGGMLQVVTFLTGMQFLMILVGALYLLAVLTVRGTQSQEVVQAAE